MKNSLLKTILLYSAIFCAVTHAQGEKREHKRPMHHGSPIEKLDTDGDEQLSLEEFSLSKKLQNLEGDKINLLFDRLDKNQDSYITPEELPHRQEKGARGRGRLESLDTNKDTKISKEEFLAPEPKDEYDTPERREKLFTMLDRNKDGFLSKEDRPNPGEHPRGPRGGKIPAQMVEQRIKRLDTNEDGELSLEEFLAGERVQKMEGNMAQEAFQRMDKNGDGVITKEDAPFRPKKR